MLTLVPSIVVYNNSGGGMERQRVLKSRLSKQDEFEEIDEDASSAVKSPAVEEDNEGPTSMSEVAEVVMPDDYDDCIEGGGEEEGDDENENENRSSSKDFFYDSATISSGDEALDKLSVTLQASTINNTNNIKVCSPAKNSSSRGKEKNENVVPHSRHRSHSKVKLLQRSHALRDDASPPPPDYTTTETITQVNTLSVSTATILSTQTKMSSGKHHRLGKQGSSHSTGSLDESSPALSRDSSLDLCTDSTGTDVQQFIINTLHKNTKDRLLLLKIEQDLINFLRENKRHNLKFPQMSAYQRMLVHRVAAFFGMDHNVDPAGTSVIVNRTKNTRIPDMKFREQIRDELIPEEPKKSILKRDSSSFDDGKDMRSPERQLSSESRRSKSFEEREEEYGKARARIFNQDSSSSQEGVVDSPLRSFEGTHNSSRRSSQEDLKWEVRPWSSTDSESSNKPSKLVITKTSASTESEPSSSGTSGHVLLKELSSETASVNSDMLVPRKHVPKASSFGGISVLARDDGITGSKSSSPRLVKAESFNASSTACVSPMTRDCPQKLPEAQIAPLKATVSTSTTVSVASSATSPIAVGSPNISSSTPTLNTNNRYQLLSTQSPSQQGQQVMWAVSNMDSVPAGSVIINPQTGQPYYNSDGSIYRHNPSVTLVQPYVSNNQQLQYQLQAIHQAQQALNFSSQGATPNQAPVYLCASTPQNTVGDQRPYIADNGGMPSNVVDVYSRLLSNATLGGTYTSSETQLIGGGDGTVHLQPPTPTSNQFNLPNVYSVPVNTIPRPTNLPISQIQQSSLSQLPLVLVSPQQTMQYFSPVSYIGNVPQVTSLSGQLTQSLESQQLQQQQQPQMNDLNSQQMMNSMTSAVQAQSFQGAQCVQNLTPSVGQTSNYMSPYISMATQSQPPVTNASVPYSAYSAFTVTPGVNLNTFTSVNGVIPATNPSQSTNFITGTGPLYTGNGMTMPGAGGIQMMVPPSVIPPNYYQTPPSFRPQTPPTNNSTQRMVAAGQQNPLVSGLSRSYSLTSTGVPSSPCSNYALYTPPVPSTPPQSINFQQNSITVQQQQQHHHQQQQQVQSTPPQTQIQYSQYPPQMLSNLQLFRPNMQFMVRPNTPPSASIIPVSGGYTVTPSTTASANSYLTSKGYNIPTLVDQRFVKTSDVYVVDAIGNNGVGHPKGAQTAMLPHSAIPNNAGIRPITNTSGNRGLSFFQGDIRFIGTPLQHHMQVPVRVPMMFPHQRPLTRMQSLQHCMTIGGGRPPRVKRQSRSRGGGNRHDSSTTPIGGEQGS